MERVGFCLVFTSSQLNRHPEPAERRLAGEDGLHRMAGPKGSEFVRSRAFWYRPKNAGGVSARAAGAGSDRRSRRRRASAQEP